MKNNLDGKNIVLCVSGGIAAYKSIEVLRLLQKSGASVKVVMTKAAEKFVGAFTFEMLSGESVYSEMFDPSGDSSIKHIELSESADLVLIAPATANIIGKLANGIADDALTTFMLAVKAPVMICPSMNTNMYENQIVQKNIDTLEKHGFTIIEPDSGVLACGVTGAGRFPEPLYILDRIIKRLLPDDLKGRKILITAGPTRESIDPVRYITNHSSGKMGYAIAKAAEHRNGNVVLVSGKTSLPAPYNMEFHNIKSAKEMGDLVFENMESSDIIIKVAAVADYRPKSEEKHKIKKNSDELTLTLEKNQDILKELGKRKKNQILVGFAAETRDLEDNAVKKLLKKNLDIIVGNIVGKEGTGFGADANKVTMFFKDGTKEDFPSMSKDEVAHNLLDRILKII